MPRVALVTPVEDFLGAPAVSALRGAGFEVVALSTAQSAPDEAAEAAVAATETQGQLDVCVMSSAFPAERAPIGAVDEALVFGPLLLARAGVPHMQARRAGMLIFCTSAAPLRELPNDSVYVSARGAMNAAVRGLALELARHNVQANAVAPNFIESETYSPKALMDDPAADLVTGQILALAGGWA